MSPTRTSPASPSTWIAETVQVPRTGLHPNSWNVNKQNAFQYAKLLESIDQYGFFDPILARPCVLHGDLEIIGGAHRWKAAGDLIAKHPELDTLPVVVRDMDDRTARKISLIDNELHGQADPRELGDLLKGLLEGSSPLETLRGLPYTDDVLKSLTGFAALPPLPAAPQPLTGVPLHPSGGAVQERWVERTYRMPADVAQVLDEALAKAKDQEKQATGQDIAVFTALEIIAADFIASS